MAYGFKINNSNSETVIDDTYENMVVASSGTLSWQNYYANGGTYGNLYNYNITSLLTATGTSQVMFKVNVGQYITAHKMFPDSSSLFTTSGTWTNNAFYINTSASSLEYIKVDKAPNVSTVGSGYGIEVYKSSGVRTWGTGQKLMPKYNSLALLTSSTTRYSSVATTGGGDVWMSFIPNISGPFCPNPAAGFPTYLICMGFHRTSSTNIEMDYWSVGIGNASAPNYPRAPVSGIIFED